MEFDLHPSRSPKFFIRRNLIEELHTLNEIEVNEQVGVRIVGNRLGLDFQFCA